MQAGADRAGRQAEDLGGLLRTKADVVVQDEDDAVVDVELAEPAIELIAIDELTRRNPAPATSNAGR